MGAKRGALPAGRAANDLISNLAALQHGVVARWQLTELGIGVGLIAHRVRIGMLHRLYRGVFAVGYNRLSQHGRWMAAVLACGPSAYLSHGTAAALWGLRGERGASETVRRSGVRRTPRGLLIHRDETLTSADTETEYGIPVVRPEKSILQISAKLDLKQITRCLAAADRSRILRWDELERIVGQSTAAGSGRLRQVMSVFNPSFADAASPGEVDFLALAAEHGIPEPEPGVLLCDVVVVDFYWADRGVAVEYDGFGYHGDRAAFEEDRQRDALLKRDGIEVLRVTHRMLQNDPAAFFATLRAVLRRRKGWAASPR